MLQSGSPALALKTKPPPNLPRSEARSQNEALVWAISDTSRYCRPVLRPVAGLRAAGAVLIGRTNMTEFAFSGVGINPHYGTPGNPYDRRLIPGGSSSGAAVSVSDGGAVVGIGTDTGGSVRIPAALCGIVGFKPTQKRVPRDGVIPLSTTLDSIGTWPIALHAAR
jgi:aspartyl-tRNA(Asn)/glutamyl-tRNA(Gln) amidotransferase subunit A